MTLVEIFGSAFHDYDREYHDWIAAAQRRWWRALYIVGAISIAFWGLVLYAIFDLFVLTK